MKRTKLIGDVFHSVEGDLGHSDMSYLFNFPEFKITAISNIPDIMNDVFIDYSYFDKDYEGTITGTVTIYNYVVT